MEKTSIPSQMPSEEKASSFKFFALVGLGFLLSGIFSKKTEAAKARIKTPEGLVVRAVNQSGQPKI